MPTDDSYRAKLDVTIALLKAWTGFVADVARIEEQPVNGSWRLSLAPKVAGACPVAITLHADQRYDLVLDGATYRDRYLSSLDAVLPLIEAVTNGRVLHRSLVSALTGLALSTSTLVVDADGRVLEDLHPGLFAAIEPASPTEIRDTHYLPYRRPEGAG